MAGWITAWSPKAKKRISFEVGKDGIARNEYTGEEFKYKPKKR